MSNRVPLTIGETVYHRDIYDHKEAMVVKGITETEVLLEGDYSGGTHASNNRCWMPLKGTSRIRNHAFKEKVRKEALRIEKYLRSSSHSNGSDDLTAMVKAVLELTQEVEYNKEFSMPNNTAFRVAVIESERRWGSKVDDFMLCLTVDDAKAFTDEFNSKNTSQTAPDWYMQAEGEPEAVELSDAQYKKLTSEGSGRLWWSTLRDIE